MKFGYDLFGLKTNSEIQLAGIPSQKKSYKKCDVQIVDGNIVRPKKGLKDTTYLPFLIYNKNFYFLEIPGIAKYLIDGDSKVTIEFLSNTAKGAAIVYFQDTVLSILLLRNNIYPIFGSSVKTKDGGVVILCAKRGEGKSALCAMLCLNGHKLVSDNFTVLKWFPEEGVFKTKAFANHIDLWQDVFPIFRKTRKTFKKQLIRRELLKFRFDFSKHTSKRWCKLDQILIVNINNSEEDLSSNMLKGLKKIEVLDNWIYNKIFADRHIDTKTLFEFKSRLANNATLNKVTRSRLSSLSDFTEFITNEISR